MNHVDTIIHCRWLVPVIPQGAVYEDTAIILHQGKILDILPSTEVSMRYNSSHTLIRDHHAILPGFVNAHTHSPMVLFRGLADDLPLMEWLNDYIWPAEAKWLRKEFIQEGTELAIAEMIKGGTTCFNEHFFFPEDILETTLKAKLRACIGPTLINFSTNWSKDEFDGFEKFKALYTEYRGHPLISWSLAPHAPYTTTNKILREIADYSEQHHLPIHMHVHETLHEIKESLKEYGQRPLQRLYDLGLMSPRLQCVHMTEVDDADLDLLQKTGAAIVHCPESNLKLASGYCKVNEFIHHGLTVALGTDGAASNNDLDMIGEMRTAALIGKVIANDATAVSASTVLQMATLNGAKILGLDKEIGSLEIGKAADLIAIDLHQVNTHPVYNPISQIVYSATNQQVTDVFVAGNALLKNKKLAYIDEESLLSNAEKWRVRIENSVL